MSRWRGSRSAQTPAARTSSASGSGLRGEHEPELPGRAVELVEHGERERDGEQRVADERDGLAGEEHPQRADPQGGQRVGDAGGGHRRSEATDGPEAAKGASTTRTAGDGDQDLNLDSHRMS